MSDRTQGWNFRRRNDHLYTRGKRVLQEKQRHKEEQRQAGIGWQRRKKKLVQICAPRGSVTSKSDRCAGVVFGQSKILDELFEIGRVCLVEAWCHSRWQ